MQSASLLRPYQQVLGLSSSLAQSTDVLTRTRICTCSCGLCVPPKRLPLPGHMRPSRMPEWRQHRAPTPSSSHGTCSRPVPHKATLSNASTRPSSIRRIHSCTDMRNETGASSVQAILCTCCTHMRLISQAWLTSTNSVLILAGNAVFFSNSGPMAARSSSSTCKSPWHAWHCHEQDRRQTDSIMQVQSHRED